MIGRIISKTARILREEGPLGIVRRVFVRLHLFFYLKIYMPLHGAYFQMKLKAYYYSQRYGRGYVIRNLVRVGYAVRSIALLRSTDDVQHLVTADVGDDALSIIPINGNQLGRRAIAPFQEWDSPISVCPVRFYNQDADGLLLCSFNLDATGEYHDGTNLYFFESINSLLNRNPDVPPRSIINRSGHWGLRCVNRLPCDDGTQYVATVDRSEDALYIIELPPDAMDFSPEYVQQVDLGYEDGGRAEPIHVGILPPSADHGPTFCISQRSRPDLTIVSRDPGESVFRVTQRIPLGGSSRSSVAVGRFRHRDVHDLAVALWGGDPKDLNKVLHGTVALVKADENQCFSDPVFFDAGVHPTDVVAGDFDGDGLDELAVLNYGAGLNTRNRLHSGSTQFFKYLDGGFRLVQEVKTPYPRIGVSVDIDGDGRDELILSLFFEKRLATIKYMAK